MKERSPQTESVHFAEGLLQMVEDKCRDESDRAKAIIDDPEASEGYKHYAREVFNTFSGIQKAAADDRKLVRQILCTKAASLHHHKSACKRKDSKLLFRRL